MKTSITAVIAAFVMLAATFNETNASDMKIAFVSMKTLFDNYYKTKQANEAFESRAEGIELKYEEMLEGIKKMEQEIEAIGLEAMDNSLSEKERKRIQKVAREKVEEYKSAKQNIAQYDEQHRKRIRREIHEQEQELISEIRGVVNEYAKTNDISILLDNSGKSLNNIETVLYFDEKLDITETLLEILNKDRK